MNRKGACLLLLVIYLFCSFCYDTGLTQNLRTLKGISESELPELCADAKSHNSGLSAYLIRIISQIDKAYQAFYDAGWWDLGSMIPRSMIRAL